MLNMSVSRYPLIIRAAFLCVLLPVLSGCETKGPLTRVTPESMHSYPTTTSPETTDSYQPATPEQRQPVKSGADKSDISRCKGQQLSCVYDIGGVALGQPRDSGSGLIRRAFKAPMHVPGTVNMASSIGNISVGSHVGNNRPSRIFTVYYNNSTGVISRIVF